MIQVSSDSVHYWDLAASPGSDSYQIDDETRSEVQDSALFTLGQTTTTINNDPNKPSPEEMPSIHFEKELFLEEIREYWCFVGHEF